MYGQNIMSDRMVCKWVRAFKDGRKNVHDEEWSQDNCVAVANFYDEGIRNLVVRYDKCLNIGGNYVEE